MASILNVDQINNAAGTSAITIDANGNPLMAGHVVQVVSQPWTTRTNTTSTSYTAVTDGTVTITPKFSTSKVLILCSLNLYWPTSNEVACVIYRGGSALVANDGLADCYNGNSDGITTASLTYLDSPATTSATTYQVYIKRTQGSGTISTNLRSTTSVITAMEIAQ